jgi:hypothetical protein
MLMSQLMLESSPVEEVLKRNVLPSLRRLSVEETDSTVVLTGRVSSYYHKQLAQEAVMPLLAGRRLLNQVEVVRE